MAKLSDEQIDRETDRQLERWRAKYAGSPQDPRIASVDFDHTARLMILHLSNRRRVVFPLEDIQGLSDATPEQLSRWGMHEPGYAIEWPELGVGYRLGGLLDGLYGNQLWMRELQAKGGSSRSDAKRQAARSNGAKGGRPRKKIPA